MIINTSKFKTIINKAVKACSNNKLFPLTSLIGINIFGDGYCCLTTFDSSNLLNVGELDVYQVDDENYSEDLVLEAVVSATQLCSLINKLNTPTIKFETDDVNLTIKSGKNSYKLPMFFEDGEVVKFPIIDIATESLNATKLDVDKFKLALKHNESCAAKSFEVPALVNAYFGDMIVTSDSVKACFTNTKLFEDPILLPYPLIKLISVFDDEFINVIVYNDRVLFFNNNYTTSVYGFSSDRLNEFPIEVLNRLLTVENTHTIKLVKKELVSCLERLSIFNDNILNVSIKNKQVVFYNETTACETLELSNAVEFDFSVALSSFLPMIRETDGEVINIAYGSDIGVSIINYDENEKEFITRILAFISNE